MTLDCSHNRYFNPVLKNFNDKDLDSYLSKFAYFNHLFKAIILKNLLRESIKREVLTTFLNKKRKT